MLLLVQELRLEELEDEAGHSSASAVHSNCNIPEMTVVFGSETERGGGGLTCTHARLVPKPHCCENCFHMLKINTAVLVFFFHPNF